MVEEQARKKAYAHLKLAMSSLDTCPESVARLEIQYDHTVVSEMRLELKMPRPSIEAKGSSDVVSTSSEAQGSAQLVSTSSEAPVSKQLVSRSSEATVTGEAVSAGSGTEVSDQRADQTVAAALVTELTEEKGKRVG